jgi:hypothetical protein
MARRSGIEWEDRALLNQLQTIPARTDRALTAITVYHANRAVKYAKTNAPWRDRTSNARNGLFAVAERDRPAYRIVVGHSVPYGIWLEVKYSGRHAIIRPTIDHEGPEVMRTVSQLFDRIFRRR